jgi:hemoglobin
MSKDPCVPICEVAIRNLVTAFHTRLRRDHVLAPVFARAVGDTDADWARHTAQEEDFWSSMMLPDGIRHRRQLLPCPRLPDLEPALFDRWLSLLGATCTDLFEPPVAAILQSRTERITTVLRRRRTTADERQRDKIPE